MINLQFRRENNQVCFGKFEFFQKESNRFIGITNSREGVKQLNTKYAQKLLLVI